MPRAIVIIPARWASSRFPGKPLAPLWGRPLLQHVHERARLARLPERVIIATDSDRIAAAARSFGAHVEMTRPDHPSGTDRVAEVAARTPAELFVNLQGDEPLIDPEAIDAALSPLLQDPSLPMSTLCCPLDDLQDLANPNVVKVALDLQGFALYFSRLPIPFARDPAAALRRRHIGLYVYRRDFLLRLAALPPTPLERAERLEQLRALEHGHRIRVVQVARASPGVDTPADLERLEAQGPPAP